MLHLDLKLKPPVEKKFVELVNNEFDGSHEKFIESVLKKRENALSRTIRLSSFVKIE